MTAVKPNQQLVEKISARLKSVNALIAETLVACGRPAGSVSLVAVSKRQPAEVVQAAWAAGLRIFGENYAEEAQLKMEVLGDLPGIEWDMIGHVQSRKAHLVANGFNRLHSLDSEKLANLIEKFREPGQSPLEAFLEINVSGESSKSGLPGWQEADWPGLNTLLIRLEEIRSIKVSGLMTMPPLQEDMQQNRVFFRRLRELRDYLNEQRPERALRELSMGTSSDYPVAIEEGATIIRLGEALLGPRPLNK